MSKVLEVYLGGPAGKSWRETYETIAAERTKFFAERVDMDPKSENYKELERVSMKDAEVIDWARRFTAPIELRNSWLHCQIQVVEITKDDKGKDIEKVRIRLAPAAMTAPATPRETALEMENENLRKQLSRLADEAVARVMNPKPTGAQQPVTVK